MSEIDIEAIINNNLSELEPINFVIKNKQRANAEEENNETKNDTNNEEIMLSLGPKNKVVEKNGWTSKNQTYFQICIHRLKYYRIINNFFFFELRKREGRLSWAIIVLSSISSILSLINTETNIFPNSIQLIKWSLVLITLIITLISAYIKKQQFIDRINDIDRYLQKLNQAIAEFDVDFIMEPEKRESYDKFCEKYIPIIKNLSLSPASFSPSEWKRTVFIITKYYPELIRGSGENDDLIWPWYSTIDVENLQKNSNNKTKFETQFGKTVLESFKPLDKIKADLLRL